MNKFSKTFDCPSVWILCAEIAGEGVFGFGFADKKKSVSADTVKFGAVVGGGAYR